jgi:hypothetical protein
MLRKISKDQLYLPINLNFWKILILAIEKKILFKFNITKSNCLTFIKLELLQKLWNCIQTLKLLFATI